MKCLIIDDQEEYLRMISKFLELSKCDLDIKYALTGVDGVRKFHCYEPDFVIIDMILPDINSFAIVRHLRNENPRLHILMVSGYDPKSYKKAALEAGVDEFLSKMDIFKDLIPAINRLVV